MTNETKAAIYTVLAILAVFVGIALTLVTKGLFLIFISILGFGVAVYFAILDILRAN